MLLLLLGPDPLRRGGLFVASWLLTSLAVLALLLGVGHSLLLTMDKGSLHRTALDLLAAGALLAVGLRDLLSTPDPGGSDAWGRRLDSLSALPLLPLLGLSSLVQVLSPDDLVLYAKASGNLLAAGLGRSQEILLAGFFALTSTLLLLLPLLALLLLGPERLLPLLRGLRNWMLRHSSLLVSVVSFGLAIYLGWQGIEALRTA